MQKISIFLILTIIILIFTVSMSGCNENFLKKFVGVWEGVSISENDTHDVILTFYNDKTAKQESFDTHIHWFFYKIDDDFLYLTLQDFPNIPPIRYHYKFSNEYNNLTLTNETYDTLKLIKQ
jgi:hypothetical protein